MSLVALYHFVGGFLLSKQKLTIRAAEDSSIMAPTAEVKTLESGIDIIGVKCTVLVFE